MKWIRLFNESSNGGEKQVIPVELSIREVMLIQNYLNKGKSLNDPENKECQDIVLNILTNIVKNSNIEEINAYVANFLASTFGITLDQDPYGQNNSIELNDAGFITMNGCENKDFDRDGEWSDLVAGGVWEPNTGKFGGGFISVDSMNELLDEFNGGFEYGIKSIKMKEDGKVAKIMIYFN